jgi:hypothetical protein
MKDKKGELLKDNISDDAVIRSYAFLKIGSTEIEYR